MDLNVVIELGGKPLVKQSKLANQIMSFYFEAHNVIASEAYESCEARDFFEEECKSDDLANHWLVACDLAFVVACGGIDGITENHSLRIDS